MSDLADKRYFKYMTRAVGKTVLENRTLRWGTPRTWKDPYDLQFDFKTDIDYAAVKPIVLDKLWVAHYGETPAPAENELGKVIRLLRGKFPRLTREEFDNEFGNSIDECFRKIQDGLPKLQKELQTLMANSKILCLTDASDNAEMWESYAEKHQGIVIRFRSLPQSPWSEARPINYLAEMPYLIDNDFLADLLSGRVSMDAKTIMHRMVYTKSTKWAHEKELRIYSGDGRNTNAPFEDIHFNARELDAVIVGNKMSQDDRVAFSALTKRLYPHAKFLEAS
jgi:hypothetical protein